MLCDQTIMGFARKEAGDLAVEFAVRPEAHDGYRVERKGGGWLVTGTNSRSCLHGLYHIQQGRPVGEWRAAFSVRGVNPCESLPCHTPGQLRYLIDCMGRWRMNRLVVHVNYGWKRHRQLITEECRKRGIELVFYVYTSLSFLPPDSPVAWLAKGADGKPITLRPECETRPCVSEAAALDAFEQGAGAFFRNEVEAAASVIATTGDGYTHCHCPGCLGMSPVEQWAKLLERFVNAGRRYAPEKELEDLLYVQRFRPPADMSIHRRLDGLMYDLHVRDRWRPLGEDHPLTCHREAEVDPAAGLSAINVYLFDRLREWREKFQGRIYMFENLNIHRSLSCPQPNTGVLLEDLRRYRQFGIDGAVYQLLNGMDSFVDQMDVLADALWNPEITYRPTPLEDWCRRNRPADVLFFLKEYNFPFEQFQDEWDATMRRHMINVREFMDRPTGANLRPLLQHLYDHPLRFGRHAIAFRFLKIVHRGEPFSGLTEREERFLQISKLWDFMEPLEDPLRETDAVILSLLQRLPRASVQQVSVSAGVSNRT